MSIRDSLNEGEGRANQKFQRRVRAGECVPRVSVVQEEDCAVEEPGDGDGPPVPLARARERVVHGEDEEDLERARAVQCEEHDDRKRGVEGDAVHVVGRRCGRAKDGACVDVFEEEENGEEERERWDVAAK